MLRRHSIGQKAFRDSQTKSRKNIGMPVLDQQMSFQTTAGLKTGDVCTSSMVARIVFGGSLN
jgi:hypothetical protein